MTKVTWNESIVGAALHQNKSLTPENDKYTVFFLKERAKASFFSYSRCCPASQGPPIRGGIDIVTTQAWRQEPLCPLPVHAFLLPLVLKRLSLYIRKA